MYKNGSFRIDKINNNGNDCILITDSNNSKLKFFWFVHDVMLVADDNKDFVFEKSQNPELFNFLSNIAMELKKANNYCGGDFVKNNAFTWHHLARSWDRPFSEEAGFVATMCDDSITIKFFQSKENIKYGTKNDNPIYVSMGGPDGLNEPYQTISNLFARVLNHLLYKLPYREKVEIEDC